jgi:2-polyprenyl-3-methyl-5-hydroxy-6-metoxy-1,4-benzoquinol methylase
MNRIPEPELMNDAQQAQAYAHADFAIPHNLFIELFQQKFPGLQINDAVLDLGCGPADISRRFVQAYPACQVHGVDGARAMLELGDKLNQQSGLSHRIQLIEACLPGASLPQHFYHVIISNSLLHHLHDPFVLWDTIQQHAKPFAHIFIMDLMRPGSEETAKQLTQQYAANEPQVLQDDFYNSLCAAFTPAEVQAQLDERGLSGLQVEEVSDRHIIIYGQV